MASQDAGDPGTIALSAIFGGLGQLINELAERYDLPGTYGAICFVIATSTTRTAELVSGKVFVVIAGFPLQFQCLFFFGSRAAFRRVRGRGF